MTLTALRPGPRTLQIALWTALLALLLEIGPGAHAAAPNADSPDASAPAAKSSVGLVIVTPPGVELGRDGARYVDELVAIVSRAMGLKPGELTGSAFGDAEAAAQAIAAHGDCFVLGSIGFYAAHRATLSLSPLLALQRADKAPERYRVIVKKGRYDSLDSLKGKTLAGSPLFESARFVDVAAFGDALKSREHFQLKPSKRPLREVRALVSEKVDAVLIDGAQFSSLGALPILESLAVLHTSEPLPSLGLMARGTDRVKSLAPRMIEAAQALCAHEEGKSLCKSFGIAGFERADTAAIDAFADKVAR